MVFKQNFVAVIKVNNKILREQDNNTVYLPFNSEYEIMLKNMESRLVAVSITIDGQDVLNGRQIIIDPNTTKTLEGFLDKNDSLKVSNRFKFIEKTEQIINYRGDKIDDGMIRIEYRFQKPIPEKKTTIIENKILHINHSVLCQCYQCRPDLYRSTPVMGFTNNYNPITGRAKSSRSIDTEIFGTQSCSTFSVNCCINQSKPDVASMDWITMDSVQTNIKSDEGLTVKGSESTQKFQPIYINNLEENSQVIILNLKGYKTPIGEEKIKIQEPITVKKKIRCETCGKFHSSENKFCSNCGTALF